jgi:hypothetical protein
VPERLALHAILTETTAPRWARSHRSEEYDVRRHKLLVSAVVMAVVGLAGCAGNDDSDDASEDPTTSADAGQVIEVTIEGDSVDPNGEKVDVDADQPVVLDITADAPGEIHVHSTPEQEIEYDAGESQHTLTFDRPGTVEVESHTLEKVIVQLQVR